MARISPEEKATEITQRWSEGISLSAEQDEQLRGIVLKRETEFAALRQKYRGKEHKEARQKAIQEVRKGYSSQIRKVLDKQQRQQLRELRAAERTQSAGA